MVMELCDVITKTTNLDWTDWCLSECYTINIHLRQTYIGKGLKFAMKKGRNYNNNKKRKLYKVSLRKIKH